MSGPWEKYKDSAPAQAGPWQQYQDVEKTQDERAREGADVGFLTRFVAKNFANSPESAAKYVKKQNPDASVTIEDGEVMIQRPGEEYAKRLDPKGVDLQDVTDLAYDVPAGLLSSAATAAGAVAGAPTVVGAVPAAVGAGAASSAALEALRQKIGQWAGIDQEISGRDVAISGAVGAASPVMFGAGNAVGVKEIAKTASKMGGDEVAAKAALEKASKGALGQLREKVFPKLGAMSSGLNEDVIVNYKKAPEYFDDIAAKNEGYRISEDMIANTSDAMRSRISQAGDALGDALDQTGRIPTAPIRQPLDELVARYKALQSSGTLDTPQTQRDLEAVENEIKLLLKKTPREAELKYDVFGKLINEQDADMVPKNVSSPAYTVPAADTPNIYAMGTPPPSSAAQVRVPSRTAVRMEAQPKMVTPDVDETMSPREAQALLAQVRQRTEFAQRELFRGGSDPLNNSLKSVYAKINEGLDLASEGLTSDKKADYKKWLDLSRALESNFGTPEQARKTLSNLDTKSRKQFMEKLKSIDPELAQVIEDASLKIRTYDGFQDPSLMPMSSGGTTSTSRNLMSENLGGGLASAVATGTGAPPNLLRTLGRLAGSVAGSPRAVQNYVRIGRASDNLTDRFMRNSLGGRSAAGQLLMTPLVSPWTGMGQRGYYEAE